MSGDGLKTRLLALLPFVLAGLFALPLVRLALDGLAYTGNGTDWYSYQLPLFRLLRSLLRAGELPTWNPGVLGGVPLLAAMQAGAAYPPTLVAALLPLEAGPEWLAALHLGWLALGGFALGNAHLGRPKLLAWGWAPFVVAILFVGSGPTWGHLWAGHSSWVHAAAWLPWVWALGLEATRHLQARRILLAAAALALQILAGHPQVVYLTLAGLTVLVGAHLALPVAGAAAQGWRARARLGGATLAAGLLVPAGAALLAAVQLLPTWHLAPGLNRGLDNGGPLALSFSASPWSLRTALAPEAWGGTAARLAPFAYHETVAHLGAAGLALAAVGLCRRAPRSWIVGAGAALFLLLSPGAEGFVLEPLLGLVPGLDAFRVPSRWLLPALGLAALLAADGVEAWLQERPEATAGQTGAELARPLLFVTLAGVFLLAAAEMRSDGLWARSLVSTRVGAEAEGFARGARQALWLTAAVFGALAAAWRLPGLRRHLALLLGLGALVEALAFAGPHLRAEFSLPVAEVGWSRPEAAAIARAVGPAQRLATAPSLRQTNWGAAHGIAVAGGYEPALPIRTNRFANLMAGRPVERYAVIFQVAGPSAFAGRLAVSHLLRAPGDKAAARAFAAWPVLDQLPSGRVLHANPAPLPRIGVPARVTIERDGARALAALAALPRDTVTLDRELPHSNGVSATARLIEERPSRLVVRTEATAPAVLVIRDAWIEGWRATVNGRPVEIAIADGLMRAVPVPGGKARVEMEYSCPGLALGLGLSLAAWATLLGALIWLWRRGGAGRTAPGPKVEVKDTPTRRTARSARGR
jgi:CheY-like chemotaxis protein